MSGDNLLSLLQLKFYSDEMTETKKIIFLEGEYQQFDQSIESFPEAA